jgi:DNA polymerase elongation subunit (family B)
MNYIKQCKETNKFSAIKNIHKYPYVFGSDYDIENWYRIQWLLEYDNNRQKKITKTFLDIEVDSISVPGFPKGGECPINAVTMIDDESNSSFTFLLENKDNPQIQEFKDNIEDFIQELHDSFDESYGFINYYIYMYEDEKELLIDLFKLINTLKRDFCLIWNMPFDIPYIIDRLRVLGLNPAQVMCHKDFKIKEVYFMKDYNNFAIANKKDYLKISSYTVFLDDMKNYAAIRKSGGQLRSYSLNAISELELKDNKFILFMLLAKGN